MDETYMFKTVQLATLFNLLSRGSPMIDYSDIARLLIFPIVPSYLATHWSVNSGCDLTSCLAEVEINN